MGQIIELARYRAPVGPRVAIDNDEASMLRLQAADLDYRADEVMKAEAEYAGKAAGKRRDGDLVAAAHYDALQQSALATYGAMDERAFQLRLKAAACEARWGFRAIANDITSFDPPGAF